LASHQFIADSGIAQKQIDRRRLLQGAAALGIGASTGVVSLRETRAQGDPTTLVIGLNGSPTDLDPHSQYDYRSVIPIRGPYEGLIILKDSETDQYEGVLAESWEANEDKRVWTFHLR
jgi:ABC-type transport system substrate-binding protein